jgi:ankyrin repeat protein
MRVASLLLLGSLCVAGIGCDSRADEPKFSKRINPGVLKSLHPTFADQTDEALLELVKENPGLVTEMDESDCTALHYAARYGRVETAKWLIGQKADVNTVSYNRFTPMHMVSIGALAELLIKSGADLDRKDAWGYTPLQRAAEENRPAVVDAILASGYKLDLRTAIMIKKRDLVKKMLKEDPKLARQSSKVSGLWGDTTPLGIAAGQKDKEIVELLLDAGADVNEGTFMPNAGDKATALTNAVWAGDKEIVKLLLDRGAKTDVTGGKFYPWILDYAREHSAREIVELLEKAGAKGSDRRK